MFRCRVSSDLPTNTIRACVGAFGIFANNARSVLKVFPPDTAPVSRVMSSGPSTHATTACDCFGDRSLSSSPRLVAFTPGPPQRHEPHP